MFEPLRALSLFLILGVSVLGALLPNIAQAQGQYINRNNAEVYLPYVLGDGFGTVDSTINRFLEAEYFRRYQALTFGETRKNRPFFVDLHGYFAEPCLEYRITQEGLCGMPGYPLILGGKLQEAATYEPLSTVQLEAFAGGKVTKDVDLSVYFTVRSPLLFREGYPLELRGRIMATRRLFAGLMPIDLGFFVGPDIHAVGSGVLGLSMGGYGLFHQSLNSASRATVQQTWWSSQEPFQTETKLGLAQSLAFMQRRLSLQIEADAILRRVNFTTYQAAFGEAPPQLSYVDLGISPSAVYALPSGVKLGLNGQILPYHAPDRNIVRWYRPVGPEVGLTVQYKLAIFDFTGAYTLSLVPPFLSASETDQDTGGPFIPGSAPGQRFAFSLGIRL